MKKEIFEMDQSDSEFENEVSGEEDFEQEDFEKIVEDLEQEEEIS